jgi:hypothetical protein
MYLFNMATLFIIVTLVGVEFSVSAFVNPAAWRLDPESQLKMLGRFALVLGRVMPVWYPVCTVLLGIQTWLHWYASGRKLLLAADAIWVAASIASIFLLVPLNSRVAEGALTGRGFTGSGIRGIACASPLAIAAILLTGVLVR